MTVVTTPKILKDDPLETLTMRGFRRGVITITEQSNIPMNALARGDNIMLYEDGAPGPRWGTAWYGTAADSNALDGGDMFIDSNRKPHLVQIKGGYVWRSLDNGQTWSQCSLSTGTTQVLTPGKKCTTQQANSLLYIVNGTDNVVMYNGTTTLQNYAQLSTPTIASVTKTGMAGAANYTMYYRIAAVNSVGFTAASSSSSGAIAVDRQRTRYDSSNYVTITWNAVVGATRYDIYVGDIAGNETYIDSVLPTSGSTPTYIDNGSLPAETTVLAPSQNTTAGPIVGTLKYVGDRLWGTRDPNNPQRTWWTGSGPYIGYFATNYDGGYIDLNIGSQFFPSQLADYRDGKGTPYTTLWCDSADGIGCVWQIQLTTQTVQNLYSFTVPQAYKVPGSRGTGAPFSVVNVLNDFMYYNSQAFYNLGSRAQFLNLLSTDEDSANIRPSVLQINPAAASGIASIFFLKKVFFSVPYGNNTSNSAIIVYDTERQAWLPYAFTYGVERFFMYVDTNKTLHLLAWKTGDTKFSEISQNIQGDYGAPFQTILLTGLQPVDKNRFNFLFCEEANVEFTQPQDTITIQLLGVDRVKGYRTLMTATLSELYKSTNVGWSTQAWSTAPWSDTSTVPQTYSESTAKRWWPVTTEINAWQYQITTNSLNANYILRTLQITGTLTNSGYPRQWRLPYTRNNL